MTPNDIRFLFAYDRYATEKILIQLDDLDAQAWGTQGVVGDRGLGAILVHMLGAHQRWRLGLEDVDETPRPEREPLPGPGELAARWRSELDATDAFLATITPDFLAQVEDGVGVDTMLVHLANHGTQHRSEAALLLTHAGRSPGDLDLIDYAESVAAGTLPDPRSDDGAA
ncbi:MAG TPA: DinB family protein [Candidatus Limnocylindrales bacterium]|nr:DinB family protein [Candidatus Limnocylindrales bacterium]